MQMFILFCLTFPELVGTEEWENEKRKEAGAEKWNKKGEKGNVEKEREQKQKCWNFCFLYYMRKETGIEWLDWVALAFSRGRKERVCKLLCLSCLAMENCVKKIFGYWFGSVWLSVSFCLYRRAREVFFISPVFASPLHPHHHHHFHSPRSRVELAWLAQVFSLESFLFFVRSVVGSSTPLKLKLLSELTENNVLFCCVML